MAGDTIAPDILARIEEIIEANGSVTQPTKDRLIIMALADIIHRVSRIEADQVRRADIEESRIKTLEDECKELKKESIVRWVRSNPKGAAALLIIGYIVLTYAGGALLTYLGLPPGLLP